uniref:Uncharacterized protein n=1 Tax=Anguilla anguilla TaxID=7936 RepID=A0A0E9XIA7_ANGAN
MHSYPAVLYTLYVSTTDRAFCLLCRTMSM